MSHTARTRNPFLWRKEATVIYTRHLLLLCRLPLLLSSGIFLFSPGLGLSLLPVHQQEDESSS